MYVMLRHIKKKKGKNKGQTTIVATVVSLLESRERCAIYNDDSKIKIQNEATVERGEIKKKQKITMRYTYSPPKQYSLSGSIFIHRSYMNVQGVYRTTAAKVYIQQGSAP